MKNQIPTVNDSEITSRHPYDLFVEWFDQATACKDIDIPEAFHLSTVSQDGYPDSRVLLLKGHEKEGFVFFTNTLSKKGSDLLENNRVCLNFYWQKLGKQIRIQGQAIMLGDDASDTYFASRPRGSQIGAWASNQSHEIPSRDHLNQKVDEYTEKFQGDVVPRPPHWKGFIVKPIQLEFWINQSDRLHDRFLFKSSGESWTCIRLAP